MGCQFICEKCGDRITHTGGVRTGPGQFYCGAKCLRRAFRDHRKALRRQKRCEARAMAMAAPRQSLMALAR